MHVRSAVVGACLFGAGVLTGWLIGAVGVAQTTTYEIEPVTRSGSASRLSTTDAEPVDASHFGEPERRRLTDDELDALLDRPEIQKTEWYRSFTQQSDEFPGGSNTPDAQGD